MGFIIEKESNNFGAKSMDFKLEAGGTTIQFRDISTLAVLEVQPANTIEAVVQGNGIRIQLLGGENVLINELSLDNIYLNSLLVTQVQATAIQELNNVFNNVGVNTGEPPNITSLSNINLVVGSSLNFTMAGTDIVAYSWYNLPTGIVTVEGNIRTIIGGSALSIGTYTFTARATNYYGETAQTITLNVNSSFTNTYSVYSDNTQLFFRGSSSFNNSPLYRADNASTTPWTVIAWFKQKYVWADSGICMHGYKWSGGHCIITAKSNLISFHYGELNINYLNAQANTGGIADTDWHMLAVTYDGGDTTQGATSYNSFKFYMDGVQISSPTWTNNNNGYAGDISGTSAAQGWRIETIYRQNLDELATYGVELNSADITSIYGGGNPIDLLTFTPTTSGANLPDNFYRFGDGTSGGNTDISSYPTVFDLGTRGQNLVKTGGTVADYVNVVP